MLRRRDISPDDFRSAVDAIRADGWHLTTLQDVPRGGTFRFVDDVSPITSSPLGMRDRTWRRAPIDLGTPGVIGADLVSESPRSHTSTSAYRDTLVARPSSDVR